MTRPSRVGRRVTLAAWLPPTAAIVIYLGLAALAYWPSEPFSHAQILGCACSDPVQETWFLAWPAYAIRHGLNPFFTSFLEYPRGVNLTVNTSMPLLGLLGAPITWLRGPVATYNALMRLSFAASATSMLFVVRRFTSWWPAAFLAGLLYGFSPYMVGEGYGHLFLTFVPLPPLIAFCAYTLLRGPPVNGSSDMPRDEARVRLFSRRRGLTFGLLCVLQFFISIEVLVTTLVCIAVVTAVVAATRPRTAIRRLGPVLWGIGAASVVFVPLVGYPVWFFLRGPQHIVGPPHAISNIAPIKADLLGAVVPTMDQLLGPSHLIAIGTSYSGGDLPENGVYLGVTLILLLVFLVVRCRHDHRVLLGAGLGLTGLVLCLGTPLMVNNHATHIPLPFDVLLHVPLIQGVAALRLSLYEQLGAAVVLGLGLDRVYREGWITPSNERANPVNARDRSRAGAVTVGLVGMIALAPLVPRFPYPSAPTAVPAYFTSGADRAIPSGSVVLTYPYDIDPDNDAMLWQAESAFRFKIFGGQSTTPGAGGRASSAVALLQPAAMQRLFDVAPSGSGDGAEPLALNSVTLGDLRSFLVRYDVGTVVVEPVDTRSAVVARDMTAALGKEPLLTGGVAVWYRADVTAAVLLREQRTCCETPSQQDPLP